MVSMRKLLFIVTLGLSGLVLKDDSKQQNVANATGRQARPGKQTKVVRPKQRTARRPTAQAARRPTSQTAQRPTAQTAQRPTAQAARRDDPAAAPSTGGPAVAQEAGSGSDTINELERLAILHARGALTNTEFSTAKAKILGTAPEPREASGEASGAPAPFPAIAANVAAARHLTGSPSHERGTPVAADIGA